MSPPPKQPQPEPEKPKRFGTFEDWLAHYDGGWVDTEDGRPERKHPPPLGVLGDVPDLPAGEIAYVRGGEIRVLELPRSRDRALTQSGRNSSPVWSPDGQFIAFTFDHANGVKATSVMRPNGADALGITRIGSSDDYSISPDGKRLAHVLRLLDLIDLDGDSVRPLRSSDDEIKEPSFSRDGRSIVFVEGSFDHYRLRIVDVETGKSRELPAGKYVHYDNPRFLPDGGLLFAAAESSAYCCMFPELVRADASGRNRRVLLQFPGPGSLSPVVSPDGKRIAAAWSARMGGFGAEWRTEVTLLGSDGSHPVELSRDYPRPFYSLRNPSWAPDSRHLVLWLQICPDRGCRLGVNSLVLVDTAAPKPKLVYLAEGSEPAWRPPQ